MSDRIVLRPALKWAMNSTPANGEYVLCRVSEGANWGGLDDLVYALPGRRAAEARFNYHWHFIPLSQLPALELIAAQHPRRLYVHATQRS